MYTCLFNLFLDLVSPGIRAHAYRGRSRMQNTDHVRRILRVHWTVPEYLLHHYLADATFARHSELHQPSGLQSARCAPQRLLPTVRGRTRSHNNYNDNNDHHYYRRSEYRCRTGQNQRRASDGDWRRAGRWRHAQLESAANEKLRHHHGQPDSAR